MAGPLRSLARWLSVPMLRSSPGGPIRGISSTRPSRGWGASGATGNTSSRPRSPTRSGAAPPRCRGADRIGEEPRLPRARGCVGAEGRRRDVDDRVAEPARVGKDLPALQEHARCRFTYALAEGPFELPVPREVARRGRARRAVRTTGRRGTSPSSSSGSARFADGSETGDRSELDDEVDHAHVGRGQLHRASSARARPIAPTAASASRSSRVNGRSEASILVVNHALYCAHLASEGRVLPEHDVVILDEAHSFAENATNAFAGEHRRRRGHPLSRACCSEPAPTRRPSTS